MARRLKLDDNGNVQFFEAAANGTNKVTLQALASLAADYTLTLPSDDGAASQFLQTDGSGVLSWANSTSTLQSAYDNGTKIDADGTEVEIEVAAAQGNVALLLDQDDDQHALSITKDGTGAGAGINVANAGTGAGIAVTQSGVAAALNVVGGAAAAVVIGQANDARALNIAKTGAGAGEAVFIDNDGTGIGLSVKQDGTGIAGQFVQSGNAICLQVSQIQSAQIALNVTQATNQRGLSVNKTDTGGFLNTQFTNAGSGTDLLLDQNGNGIALDIDSEATTAVGINVDMQASATGDAINIIQAGDAIGIDINKTGTGAGVAFDVENDGTGIGCLLNQDGNGIALSIDSEATGQPLIQLLGVVGNSRGDVFWGTGRNSDPASPSETDTWYNTTDDSLKTIVGSVKRKIVARHTITSAGTAGAILTLSTDTLGGTNTGFQIVAAETGTTDDLSTISVGSILEEGDIIILQADAGDTITVKHAVDNILLDGSADKALVNNNILSLYYDGSNWLQLTPMMVLP